MKKITTAALLLLSVSVFAQNWAWLKGTNLVFQESVYSTQGVTSPSNLPGARMNAGSWYLNHDYYLFGGMGISGGVEGMFSDLWKYDSAAGNWAWLKGNGTLNQLSVYGTKGVAATSNNPGARVEPMTWTYNNELYIYGGQGLRPDGQGGFLGVFYSDMWKYSPATNMWTWVQGNSTFDDLPVFGTKGVPDAANTPGCLADAVSWVNNGKLYLFSGVTSRPPAISGSYNNVWEFNPATNNWTWINGSGDVFYELPFFDAGNVNSTLNTPGGRITAQGIISGNEYYLFGGSVVTATSPDFLSPVINDLWKFKHATNSWERVQTGTYDNAGSYGTINIPSASNKPPGRTGGAMCQYGNNLYLFGGSFPPYTDHQFLNDLWRYDIGTQMWTWIKGSNQPVQPFGSRGPLGLYQASNTPGGRSAFNAAATNTGMYFFGGTGYFDPAEQTSPFTLGNEGTFGDLWKLDITNTSPDISCGNKKVLVCHIPPGNPANAQTICISENAVAAHLAHGDHLGPCTSPSNNALVGETESIASSLTVKVLPNPSAGSFAIRISSLAANEKVRLIVYDGNGKQVEELTDQSSTTTITLGEKYQPGVYVVKISQGTEQRVVKLIRL